MEPADAIMPLALAAATGLAAQAARRDLQLDPWLAAAGVAGGAAACALAAAAAGAPIESAAPLGMLAVLCILVAEIDRRHFLIPDLLTAAIVLVAFVAPFAPSWREQFAAAALLGGVFLSVRWLFARLGRREALGLGDAKLAAAMGLVIGVHDGLTAVAMAGAATALVSILHTVRTAKAPTIAPFGIGLAASLSLMAVLRT